MKSTEEKIEKYRSLHKDLRQIKSWKSLIQKISDEWKVFEPKISDKTIKEIENKLKVRFPKELKNLYSETDGIKDEYGYDVVFPIESLIPKNLEMREFEGFKELYMPFDNLLFIGEYGNGDLFAFPIMMNGKIEKREIFVWDHEFDDRKYVAGSIRDLIYRRKTGLLD